MLLTGKIHLKIYISTLLAIWSSKNSTAFLFLFWFCIWLLLKTYLTWSRNLKLYWKVRPKILWQLSWLMLWMRLDRLSRFIADYNNKWTQAKGGEGGGGGVGEGEMGCLGVMPLNTCMLISPNSFVQNCYVIVTFWNVTTNAVVILLLLLCFKDKHNLC